MKKLTTLLFVLSICHFSNAQVRQRSTTQGFNAAAQFHVLGWTSEYFEYLDNNAPTGIGGGVRLGYGITQLFEPYIGLDFTRLGTSDVDAKSFSMMHLDFGLRLNFAGTVHPVRPFVEGGYSFRQGTVKEVIAGTSYVNAKFSGGTPHVGGGLSYFLKVPVSLFARGLFTVGKTSSVFIDDDKTGDKADVTTFRIGVGVNFNIGEMMQNR